MLKTKPTVNPVKKDIHALSVSSDAFADQTCIPAKYTCDGKNVNPPINIGGIPPETKSLAIVVDDPDAPAQTWTHWLVWNIMPSRKIKENNVPGIEGMNDFKVQHYSGPCPPSGTHHYHFKVYALDDVLDLKPGSSKHELEKTMSAHILAFGELVALYKKEK